MSVACLGSTKSIIELKKQYGSGGLNSFAFYDKSGKVIQAELNAACSAIFGRVVSGTYSMQGDIRFRDSISGAKELLEFLLSKDESPYRSLFTDGFSLTYNENGFPISWTMTDMSVSKRAFVSFTIALRMVSENTASKTELWHKLVKLGIDKHTAFALTPTVILSSIDNILYPSYQGHFFMNGSDDRVSVDRMKKSDFKTCGNNLNSETFYSEIFCLFSGTQYFNVNINKKGKEVKYTGSFPEYYQTKNIVNRYNDIKTYTLDQVLSAYKDGTLFLDGKQNAA